MGWINWPAESEPFDPVSLSLETGKQGVTFVSGLQPHPGQSSRLVQQGCDLQELPGPSIPPIPLPRSPWQGLSHPQLCLNATVPTLVLLASLCAY